MVKLSIQSENECTNGLYTDLGAIQQIIDIIHNKSDEVEIEIKYKVREQAVQCSPSIRNPFN